MVKKNDPKSSAWKRPVEGKECNILKLNKFGLLKGEKKKKINLSRCYEVREGKSWSQRILRPIESLAGSY